LASDPNEYSSEDRADEVLASHALVPAEYFEALLVALDEPDQPNEALISAVQDRRRFKRPSIIMPRPFTRGMDSGPFPVLIHFDCIVG
jgi:hypothetical protein